MSFIRTHSNPEKLYVFQSEDGIEFWWPSPKTGRIRSAVASVKDFKGLLKKLKSYDGYVFNSPIVRSGKLSVHEVRYNPRTFRVVKYFTSLQRALNHGDDGTKYMVQLTIGKKRIIMYFVTWMYIYRNAAELLVVNKPKKKKKSCLK